MKKVISELDQLIIQYQDAFSRIPEEDFVAFPAPGKWSKKQIIGHLIDSAHNNYRRFVTGQYETQPPNIWYDQNFWVEQNNYQEMGREELITLWTLMNRRIIAILNKMQRDNFEKQVNTGRNAPQYFSLNYIAEDYLVHMNHHIHQIFPAE